MENFGKSFRHTCWLLLIYIPKSFRGRSEAVLQAMHAFFFNSLTDLGAGVYKLSHLHARSVSLKLLLGWSHLGFSPFLFLS